MRVLVIIERPTDPALIRDLHRQKSELFKEAQGVASPDIAGAVTSRLSSILAPGTTAAERDRLIDEAMVAIAAMSGKAGLDARSSELVHEVLALRTQEAGMRSLAQCTAELATLRSQLNGKPEEAFRQAARRVSQGPHASDGGDCGWKSPGEFPAEVDQRIFATTTVGGLSEVFTANDAAWLVEVAGRKASSERSFDAVLGELELQLFDTRHTDPQAQGRRRAAQVGLDRRCGCDQRRMGAVGQAVPGMADAPR